MILFDPLHIFTCRNNTVYCKATRIHNYPYSIPQTGGCGSVSVLTGKMKGPTFKSVRLTGIFTRINSACFAKTS